MIQKKKKRRKELFGIFSSKVQNLTVFSINSMIRIRFSGSGEFIWKAFRRARYEYDDVVRALVRLDRLEMRPGTSGQSGKTIPTYFTDPELDAPTFAPRSEIWTQPSMDRTHWNEVFDALQEDVDFCEDGETTIVRDGAIAIPGVFYITDDRQEEVEENEVPQR